MLASISPVGEHARGGRWFVTTTAYVVGSTVGGLAVGAGFGAGGALATWAAPATPRVAAGALAALALLGLVVDRRGVPTLRRQVDERWLTTYRGWVYGAGFGFQLGGAVVTTVTASATYVVLLGAFASGSWRTGAVIGGCFGLARSLPLVATRRLRDPALLRERLRTWAAWERPIARLTGTGQLGVAGVAALAAVGVVT
jgi:hypothetical protein